MQPSQSPQRLVFLAADLLAASPHLLTTADLLSIGETLTALLLHRILQQQRLTYSVAEVFLKTRFALIVDACKDLDLLAGIPPPLAEECAVRRRL